MRDVCEGLSVSVALYYMYVVTSVADKEIQLIDRGQRPHYAACSAHVDPIRPAHCSA